MGCGSSHRRENDISNKSKKPHAGKKEKKKQERKVKSQPPLVFSPDELEIIHGGMR